MRSLSYPTSASAGMAEPELKAGHGGREAALGLDPALWQHLQSARQGVGGGGKQISDERPSFPPHYIFSRDTHCGDQKAIPVQLRKPPH